MTSSWLGPPRPRPPPQQSFGTAVHQRELRGVAVGLVIHLLHEPLLVIRCEQREDRRHLVRPADDPLRRLGELLRQRLARSASTSSTTEHEIQVPGIAPVPVRQRLLRVRRWSAACFGFDEQGCVVFLCGLERIGTDDGLARVVAIAMAPGCRCRVAVFECPWTAGVVAPDRVERDRTVAAVVVLVHPQRAIEVEVLRCKDVARQRLHADGRLSAGGGGAGLVVPRRHRAHELVFGIAVELRKRNGDWPSPADALLRSWFRLARGSCERPHHDAHADEEAHTRNAVPTSERGIHRISKNTMGYVQQCGTVCHSANRLDPRTSASAAAQRAVLLHFPRFAPDIQSRTATASRSLSA
jgi:hypothetical protein